MSYVANSRMFIGTSVQTPSSAGVTAPPFIAGEFDFTKKVRRLISVDPFNPQGLKAACFARPHVGQAGGFFLGVWGEKSRGQNVVFSIYLK